VGREYTTKLAYICFVISALSCLVNTVLSRQVWVSSYISRYITTKCFDITFGTSLGTALTDERRGQEGFNMAASLLFGIMLILPFIKEGKNFV